MSKAKPEAVRDMVASESFFLHRLATALMEEVVVSFDSGDARCKMQVK
jgi:hypothetical protein